MFGFDTEIKPSLNSEKRRRELNRINNENHKLLKRLQEKKPYYNVAKWENDRSKSKHYLSNICTYPYILGKRHRSVPKRRLLNIKHSANTTKMNFTKGLKFPPTKGMKSIGDDSAEDNATNQSNPDGLNKTNEEGKKQLDMSQTKTDFATDRGGFDSKPNSRYVKSKYSRGSSVKKVRPLPTEGTAVTSQRILLYEKTAKIGNKDYLIEISRDKLHLFIIAFLIEKAKYYTLQLPIKKAFKLLLDLDNSFDALIGLLYFNYNTLLIPDIQREKFSPRHIPHTSTNFNTTQHEPSLYKELQHLDQNSEGSQVREPIKIPESQQRNSTEEYTDPAEGDQEGEKNHTE